MEKITGQEYLTLNLKKGVEPVTDPVERQMNDMSVGEMLVVKPEEWAAEGSPATHMFPLGDVGVFSVRPLIQGAGWAVIRLV